jgi:hypothetical protein
MDELKRDISPADAKFTRVYKPTTQITEYLTARTVRQGVAAPAFLVTAEKLLGERESERTDQGSDKRRGKLGNRRPMYPVDAEEYDEGADPYQGYGYDEWTDEYEHDMYVFQSI